MVVVVVIVVLVVVVLVAVATVEGSSLRTHPVTPHNLGKEEVVEQQLRLIYHRCCGDAPNVEEDQHEEGDFQYEEGTRHDRLCISAQSRLNIHITKATITEDNDTDLR